MLIHRVMQAICQRAIICLPMGCVGLHGETKLPLPHVGTQVWFVVLCSELPNGRA